MTSSTCAAAEGATGAEPIPFPQKFALSPQFKALFDEGMALVERTANYLDGPGRAEAKRLKPPLNVAYATESMRLTTRLMQLASWLLLQRALHRGEIGPDQAASPAHRVPIVPVGRSTRMKGYDELPATLRELVEASLRLHDRIMRLDRAMNTKTGQAQGEVAHPVAVQLDRLRVIFGGR